MTKTKTNVNEARTAEAEGRWSDVDELHATQVGVRFMPALGIPDCLWAAVDDETGLTRFAGSRAEVKAWAEEVAALADARRRRWLEAVAAAKERARRAAEERARLAAALRSGR